MYGRSGLMLVLAIGCGLAAMYGARQFVAREKAPVETRDVLVAARDINNEEILKEDMVKVIQVPKASAAADAFAKFVEVEARWAKMKILADEPILDRKLAPKNAPPGLIPRIPRGMRAVTVEVNEQSGVSGFVLPDHRVDVLLSTNPGQRGGAEVVLEDVLVLAAGQLTARPEDKSVQVRTVTLALTTDQVTALVAARGRGPLSLALRGLDDHTLARRPAPPRGPEPPRPDPPAVTRVAPPPTAVAARPSRPTYITVFRGTGISRVRYIAGTSGPSPTLP